MTLLRNASEVLTIAEVKDILFIGRNQAYELIRTGELTGFKLGNSWRVSKPALINFIEKREQQEME